MADADNNPEILVLQGGGALGSYQAGVYEALHGEGIEPDWLAGISIGSVNAAIIAGNPPERRIDRLREFWQMVSSELIAMLPSETGDARRWFNEMAAGFISSMGAPGFFRPRTPLDFALPCFYEPLSIYDTSPLRETLLNLVDFDLLNDGDIRVSFGAVNVRTGNFAYFDNRSKRIEPEHVMASGALPPGFPPVEIEGEYYWDGGLVSNTPLQYVLDTAPRCDMNVFQVDLFNARGEMPKNISEVLQRDKDIRYSSRTRINTDLNRQIEELCLAAGRLAKRLPPEWRDDPDVKALAALPRPGSVSVMHLINRREQFETQSKDYEFSRATVNGHWSSGLADGLASLRHPLWQDRSRTKRGIVTFDLTNPDGPKVRGGFDDTEIRGEPQG